MTRRKDYLPMREPKYKVYHQAYDKHRLASPILNGGSQGIGVNTVLWDERNLKAELKKLTTEVIPEIEEEIINVDRQYKVFIQDKINNGFTIPKELPVNLFEAKLRWEAAYDVAQEEIAEVEKKLKTYIDKVTAIDNSQVLEYGLKCRANYWGTRAENENLINVIKVIDGQEVRFCKKGILVIRDERSPYNGMSLADYRKLADEWRIQIEKKQEAELKRLQRQAKEQGKPIPNQLSSLRKTVNKADLPPYPTWAKKYTE